MKQLYFLFILFLSINLSAQVTFPKAAVSDTRAKVFAFENATIFTDYQTKLENAVLVIRDGKIESCGTATRVPDDAVRIDCQGKFIYPAFIDIYAAGFGLPKPEAVAKKTKKQPQMYSNQSGPYAWNESLKPEFDAVEAYTYNAKEAKAYLEAGFATLLTFQPDGISRGTGALVSPIKKRPHDAVITGQSAHFLSLRKGKSTQNYPNSLMGTIALLRQTYLDAEWYKNGGDKKEKNLSLDAWNANQNLPQFFDSEDVLDALRIGKLAAEFQKGYIIKSAGDDYQKLDDIKRLNMSLVLPLDFPEDYKVDDPFDAQTVSLSQLKHWEMAPSNPAHVASAGLPFAFTTKGLKKKKTIFAQIQKAIDAGLDEKNALRALTTTPAEMLNMTQVLGSLSGGKYANFIITNGPVFSKKTKLMETWSMGEKHEVTSEDGLVKEANAGKYNLILDGDMLLKMDLVSNSGKPKITILKGDDKIKTKSNINGDFISLSFSLRNTDLYQLSGIVSGTQMKGNGTDPNGEWITWEAVKKEENEEEILDLSKKTEESTYSSGKVFYPFTAFGWDEKPKTETVLVRNASVWTSEKEGVLENADVLFSKGKIQKIGNKLNAPDNAIIVDGTGKYLTAGIVDEHSHIAVSRGVNEGTQESSAEVRVGDAINSEDVNIYRQLAGGVTSSHILHGSANPIGGQTQLLKMRWGATPEEMKFKNWDGFIKFALGENVKQSNWGDNYTSRFPQTRMGVEQVFRDYFTRAQEYKLEKRSNPTFRRDLEMDCLLEIIEKKRFITCHSYVQSEINMLMKVAEDFDFRLNTFTHILEGYKVADKMAEHGAGASTFSDWWAYKFEVYQAIPYNAALMAEQGVLVAINSDDREMARRLNQEAAKAVKYGGMSEQEAWKTVTLNPAKLLHIDDRVGSIKTGKDADLVLWSANPLSIYAQVEHTWVDGIRYFDKDKNKEMQQAVQLERKRIITKMLNKGRGKKAGKDQGVDESPEYHCDSVHDEG